MALIWAGTPLVGGRAAAISAGMLATILIVQVEARLAKTDAALLLAILAVSLGKDMLIDGHLPAPANVAFHLLFGGLSVAGMTSRRSAVHHAIAVAAALMMTAYIAALFARLG